MEKFNELIQGEVPVLVDFFATWCGPCKVMHPVLEEVKKHYGERLKIIKIDIDKPANRQPVYTYHVQSVPTLLLFKKGRLLWQQSGAMHTPDLIRALDVQLG